jgi:hypothetical protein
LLGKLLSGSVRNKHTDDRTNKNRDKNQRTNKQTNKQTEQLTDNRAGLFSMLVEVVVMEVTGVVGVM